MSASSPNDLPLLSALHGESSPVSIATLQSYVVERAAAKRTPTTKWAYGFAASLAIGAAVVITWLSTTSRPLVQTPIDRGSAGIVQHTARSFASAFEQMSRLVSPDAPAVADRNAPSFAPSTTSVSRSAMATEVNGANAPAPATAVAPTQLSASPKQPATNAAIVEATDRSTTPATQNHVGEPAYRDPQSIANQGRIRISAALQSGIVMGSLNTIAGGAAMTVSHDWQSATVRYTSTFGTRTSDLLRTRPFEQNSQDIEEYAIMVGGVLRQGDFWASLEAGPNVIHATFIRKNENVATGQWQDASDMIRGSWGASAQATFGYQVSKYAGLSLTGFVSNHSITYGGVLVSLVAGPF